MDKLFPKIKNFQSASLTLITDLPINAVINFSDKYKINNYKNIVVGTEAPSYFIGNYYHVSEMPFVALYDKNGNFISSYQKNIPIDELAAKLSKLK